MTERTASEIIDLLGKLTSPRGPGYRDENVRDHSYYNDPVDDRGQGEPTGNSRRHGDIPAEDQVDIMNRTLDAMNQDPDLDSDDKALLLAIMKHESGFNPDAAAGTTSAHGLGQFVDGTWEDLGGTDADRSDIDAQIDIMIDWYKYLKDLAQQAGKDIDDIYRRHHDGPNNPNDLGGQGIYDRYIKPTLGDWKDFVDNPIAPDDIPTPGGEDVAPFP